MDKLDLSRYEQEALSGSLQTIQRKRLARRGLGNPLAWATGLALIAALWGSLAAVVCLITLYIWLNVLENLRAYRTLVAYSTVVRKMAARIEELEATRGAP